LVAAAKFLVAATKNLFVFPNFVAVAKPFLSVNSFKPWRQGASIHPYPIINIQAMHIAIIIISNVPQYKKK